MAPILGDNVLYGQGFARRLGTAAECETGTTVPGCFVRDPLRYAAADSDEGGEVISLEQKPEKPQSHCALTGLYLYDGRAQAFPHELTRSAHGRFQSTAVSLRFPREDSLRVELLGRSARPEWRYHHA